MFGRVMVDEWANRNEDLRHTGESSRNWQTIIMSLSKARRTPRRDENVSRVRIAAQGHSRGERRVDHPQVPGRPIEDRIGIPKTVE
jgi:hypothetical protein